MYNILLGNIVFFFSFSVSGAAVLFVSFNHSFQPDNFLGTE